MKAVTLWLEESYPEVVAARFSVRSRKNKKSGSKPAFARPISPNGPPGAHAASSSVVGPRTGEAEGIIPSQTGSGCLVSFPSQPLDKYLKIESDNEMTGWN